mgnify:CR=1 FL=1
MIYIFYLVYYIFGICFFIIVDIFKKDNTLTNININNNLEEPLIATSTL